MARENKVQNGENGRKWEKVGESGRKREKVGESRRGNNKQKTDLRCLAVVVIELYREEISFCTRSPRCTFELYGTANT